MAKRLKLMLAGTTFLAVNATVWPLLIYKSHLKFLDLAKHLGYGGTIRARRDVKGDDYRLELDSRSGQHSSSLLDIQKDSSSLTDLKLQLEPNDKGLSFSNSTLEDTTKNNHLDSIKDVFSEITREDSVGKFFEKIEGKYGEAISKYLEREGSSKESMLKNFLSAKLEIQKWIATGRKDISTALNRNQRVSLQKFYELFKDLTSQGKGFVSELDHIADREQTSIIQETKPFPKDVVGILRKIRWTGNKILVFSDPNISWDSNIYKYFYDSEEDFKRQVDSVREKEAQLKALQRSQAAEASFWGGYSRSREMAKFNQQRIREMQGKTQSEVEYQIGSRLLGWIQQLGK